MSLMKEKILNAYFMARQNWIDFQDPRTKEYKLVTVSPVTFVMFMGAYLLFATKWGPKIMKNREPYKLRGLMLIYNLTMVLVNAYFFTLALIYCEYGKRFLNFKYPDRSDNSPQTLWEIRMGFFYWITKFMDLFDTIFFVLRKKQSHVTFLHLYHHTAVPSLGWLILKHNPVFPGSLIFTFINSFVHTIMYSYYFLSALGPEVQKYLWWKRYLTQLQLGQFIFGLCYGVLMVFFQEGYPQFWFWFSMTQPPIFIYMFYDFYKRAYRKDKKVHSHVKCN